MRNQVQKARVLLMVARDLGGGEKREKETHVIISEVHILRELSSEIKWTS